MSRTLPVTVVQQDSSRLDAKEQVSLEERRACYELERAKRSIELEAAREKTKIDLAVERALDRQKLLNAGLTQEEVDRILPEE